MWFSDNEVVTLSKGSLCSSKDGTPSWPLGIARTALISLQFQGDMRSQLIRWSYHKETSWEWMGGRKRQQRKWDIFSKQSLNEYHDQGNSRYYLSFKVTVLRQKKGSLHLTAILTGLPFLPWIQNWTSTWMGKGDNRSTAFQFFFWTRKKVFFRT